VLQKKMPAVSDDNKVLLCGPPGLVNATKNNLTELGWKEPGSVSKMTDQIFCF
jgi:cytochrome-b5 reductase